MNDYYANFVLVLESKVRNRTFRKISDAALCYILGALHNNVNSLYRDHKMKHTKIPRGFDWFTIVVLQTIIRKMFVINLWNPVKKGFIVKYKPISVLLCLSKMLEKIIYSPVYKQLNEYYIYIYVYIHNGLQEKRIN